MSSHCGWTFALVVLLAGSALPVASQAQSVVTTGAGQVRGLEEDGVTAFRGIPFAAPPVGDRRWRAPEPAAAWTGVRDGSRFGATCLQAPRKDGPAIEVSEDCLYLNVWRPAGAMPRTKLPVMVWIYGGGFTTGSTAWPVYSGAPLARNGVVLVTINYRLGYFGWFAHPELTRESAGHGTGNFGLMDQIAALKWVQTNIAAFGGDPANVTIFGESAGGISVNDLMISDRARGLFSKAITQSGPVAFPIKDLAAAEAAGVRTATDLGAPTLAQLRALPAEIILNYKPSVAERGAGPATAPIVDGVIIPDAPRKVFEAGREARVPWIDGNVEAETASLQSEQSRLAFLDALPKPLQIEVRDAYDPRHEKDRTQLSIEVTTDVSWAGSTRRAAADHGAHGLPTYRYVFAYVPEAARVRLSSAHHGSDIPFTLNTLGARAVGDITAGGSAEHPMTVPFSDNDWRISHEFGRYLTNFAKTGDPNGPGLTRWDQDKPDVVMVIDKSGFHSIPGYRKRQFDMAERLSSQPPP